jgi:hypothetical protein
MDAISGDLSKDLGINIHFIGDVDCINEPRPRSVDDTRKYLNQGHLDRVFNKYMKKTGCNVFGDRLVVTGKSRCLIPADTLEDLFSSMWRSRVTMSVQVLIYHRARSLLFLDVADTHHDRRRGHF